MKEFEIAFLPHKKAPAQDWISISLKNLYNDYLNQAKIGKKEGHAWMPARIEAGSRSAERVEKINLLVLDVEGHTENCKDNQNEPLLDEYGDRIKKATGPTPPAFDCITAELKARNMNCAAHTTYSHHGSILPKEEEHPRYRLIFTLSRPLSNNELKPLGEWIAALLGLTKCYDHSALEPARLYYLPRCPQSRCHLFQHEYIEGCPLDVDQLLQEQSQSLEIPCHANPDTQHINTPEGLNDIFSTYNQFASIDEILAHAGYEQVRQKRWIAPQSTSGEAGVRIIPDSNPPLIYSSHANDPLADDKPHDAYDCMRILMHNGDHKAAFKTASDTLAQAGISIAIPLSTQPASIQLTSAQREPEELIIATQSAPYPIEALPAVIRDAVKEVNGFIQAPLAMVASSALASLSVVLQPMFDVRRASKLEGPSSLFFLTLADSGERKSTCDRYFSEPLKAFEIEQRKQKEPELQQYRAEFEAWNSQKSGLQQGIKAAASKSKKSAGDSQTTQEIAELKEKMIEIEQQEPKKPKIPRLIYMDATPEALACELHEGWPSGAMVSSEAGLIFGSHGMGKDSVMRNMSLFNLLWDGAPVTIDRKTSESFALNTARFSMSLQIQETAILEFLDKSGELARGIGFLARFLVANPDSTQGTRLYAEAPFDWPALDSFHARISALLEKHANCLVDDELTPELIDLNEDAKQHWIQFHDEIETQLCRGGNLQDIRDVASKTADNAARLACLLQMFSDSTSTYIGVDAMSSAIQIVRWHLYESLRFLSMVALPQDIANAIAMEKWLAHYCLTKRVTTIPKNTFRQKGPSRLRSKATLEAALEMLTSVNRAWLVVGSSPALIQLHPKVIEQYAL